MMPTSVMESPALQVLHGPDSSWTSARKTSEQLLPVGACELGVVVSSDSSDGVVSPVASSASVFEAWSDAEALSVDVSDCGSPLRWIATGASPHPMKLAMKHSVEIRVRN